jgi:hypothetical protein
MSKFGGSVLARPGHLHWRIAPLPLVAVLSGLWFGPSTALAAPPQLAGTVLTTTLPGLVAAPPGNYNGPLTVQNATTFGSSEGQAMAQQIEDGNMSGYVRTWGLESPGGDTMAIVAFGWTNPDAAGSFFAGLNHGIQVSGASPLSAPQVPGGYGFVSHLPLAGQSATEYSVTFNRGDTVVEVESGSIPDDITFNAVQNVALRQSTALPGAIGAAITPSQSSDPTLRFSYDLGEALPFVLLVILALWLVQRHRRKSGLLQEPPSPVPLSLTGVSGGWPTRPVHPFAPGPSAADSVHAFSPLDELRPLPTFDPGQSFSPSGRPSDSGSPVQPLPPAGWYPDPGGLRQLRYFDGQQWTPHVAAG